MAIEYLPISWTIYHDQAQDLAERILTTADPIDEIVAIARGGLALGHILSDLLRAPISTFAIQSYEDYATQGEAKVTAELQHSIEGKHILLVDDVADTGKTLVRAVEYLKDFKPKKITTATVFYKPQSVYKPDFFAEETSKWILFPTEDTEMITLIFDSMKKDGKSENDAETLLTSLGYSAKRIAFVRKFHTT